MKKNARILLILAVLSATFGWSTGCRDDKMVDYPPSVIGDYTGIYSYLEIEGIYTNHDTFQYVTFRFTSSTYTMKLNEKWQSEETRFFCDVEGQYELQDGVRFTEKDPNLTNKVCTYGHNPFDFFGLNQNTGNDTIIIKQDKTDEEGVRTVKLLRLVPKN